ncbi:FMN-dependent NADH-azoreductase [Paraburkholderia caribensis MBA4]|uniref:FMN dependent NADH:quinone oxidoreductase n=1 Tax=Paraburkholderia caribensis MBA4 TaxID=1323664 RepID=A0A0P0RG22_9BURK|nr:NAD(P)H-dependent oxidoreductase [Paraburkholderia caribensis]ALL67622.1 FMN-dependent NADH-azoreductase [Paraburkholderia caribensis MBA4]
MNSKLLVIRSSIKSDGGASGLLGDYFVQQYQKIIPETSVVVRDLADSEVSHLNARSMEALSTGTARCEATGQVLQLSNELIEEIREADRIVMCVPRYNFCVPSIFHAYIDLLVRAGVTFRYTENGPVGLIASKPVFIITTSGGIYSGAGDSLAAWLSQVLNFVGLEQIEYVYAEGLEMGKSSREQGLRDAHLQIDLLLMKIARIGQFEQKCEHVLQ